MLRAGLMSMAVVAAEASSSPSVVNLSVVAYLLRNNSTDLLFVQLVCMISLSYIVCCAYFTLFRVG